MKRNIKAIIFDLDDTLYEERQFVYSGYRVVSDWINEKYNIDIFLELKELFDSGFRGDVFTPILSKYMNVKESFIKQLVKVYREHKPSIRLYDDASYILNKLHDKYKLAIITDGYLEVQKNKVKSLNVETLFDTIIYSDIYGRDHWKPDIVPYTECFKCLNVQPNESVYVADNPTKDFVSAKKLGMLTIRVKRENTEHFNCKLSDTYEADMEVNNLCELLNYF